MYHQAVPYNRIRNMSWFCEISSVLAVSELTHSSEFVGNN